jgi:hypothetical protein
MNDAAMQALGSDNGGRLLFLGLGTGLGSAMVVDGILCRRPIPGRGSRVCAPGMRSRGDERRVYRGPVGWLDAQRPVQVVGERPDVPGQVPWDNMHVFWGDERHMLPDHPDSNYRMANEALLSKVPIPPANVHRIKSEHPDWAHPQRGEPRRRC